DVTLGTHRCVYMSTGNTNRIVNLPATADGVNARVYEVYKIDAGTGTVTLHPSTTNTLNGVNSDVVVSNRYEGWRIVEERAMGWILGVGGSAPIGVAQGGTGATTFTAHGVLIGNTTSAVQATSAGTSGQCFLSNGASADPSFQTCPSGGTSALS